MQQRARYELERLVLVDNLDAMLVGLGRHVLPYGCKVAVHDDGRRRVFDVARTGTAVDCEGRHRISGVPAEWLERIFVDEGRRAVDVTQGVETVGCRGLA